MSTRLAKTLCNFLIAFGLVFPAAGFGAELNPSQTPLFISQGVKHNVVFVMDDSRYMDMEVLFGGAAYGRADDETLTTWIGNLIQETAPTFDNEDLADFKDTVTNSLIGNANYGYLFETFLAPESGGTREYNGQRLNEDYLVVPPISAYGFMRSSAYNPQYYDPSVSYEPWSGSDYANAEIGNPLLDPNYELTFEEASTTAGAALLDGFTSFFEDSWCAAAEWWADWGLAEVPEYCNDNYPLAETKILPFAFSGALGEQLRIGNQTLENAGTILSETVNGSMSLSELTREGLGCTAEQISSNLRDFFGDLVQDVFYQCVTFTPATYYVPVENGSYSLWFDPLNQAVDGSCSNPNPENFALLVEQWSLENSLVFEDSGGNSFQGALAPDGRCLKKVTVNEEKTYNAGTDYERSFAEEMQNFSNWFQYHRRRHQSARFALAESLQSISGVRADLTVVNDQATPVAMLDTDDRSAGGDFETLLEKVFHAYDDVPATNESPLRGALDYVGTQYQRQNTGAPIQYECQRNYALMYTDGFASDYGAGQETLGDIASTYYTGNLRPDMPAGQVNVPGQCIDGGEDSSLDCISNLHMNTFGVLLGAKGSVYGREIDGTLYDSVADAYLAPPTWPDANDTTDPNIFSFQLDDVYRATVEGKGEIYNARLPGEITDGLNKALEDIDDQSGAAAAVTFSSATVESDSLIFSAIFNSRRWSGQLAARSLNSSNGRLVQESGSYIGDVVWEAGSELDQRNLDFNPRQIITYDATNARGEGFAWANLTSDQRADLLDGTEAMDTTAAETLAKQRLAYLRGDRTREVPSGDFRPRDSRLGDIVHSAPVFVDRPSMGWPDRAPYGLEGDRYSDFRNSSAISNRTPVVYVGANDGMLHAFEGTRESTGGKELFAYVPDLIFSSQQGEGLHYLTEPGYLHRYYVDLTPTVADAYIDIGDGTGDSWRTVLIGGLRAGGRGLFALDITDPDGVSESTAEDLVLWEFVDDDLGYITEPVNIMLTDMGAGYEWVAVFGNGLDAPSGRTGLFILRLEGGLDGTWTENSDYWFLEMDSGPSGGMNSDVRLIDLDADNLVDRIYGSDLDGRIWALAYDADNDEWNSAYGGNGGPEPLFTTPAGQPVTSAPMVVRNADVGTSTQNYPNLLVLFGTGRYLTQSDITSEQSTQSFYAIWDSGVEQANWKGELLERDITETSTEDGIVRNLSDATIVWNDKNSEHLGWYIDFDTRSGERVVMMPQVRGSTILFNTTIPPTNDCASNGASFRMLVDLDGTDPDRQVFDTNGDGVVNNQDRLASGFFYTGGILSMSRILGNVMFDNTAGGTGQLDDFTNENVVDFGDQTLRGRLGWRELISR
ncbi:type IV pilus assembly protein PilY1 [Marinobacter pelagius]|uniref:Type IV pilus assembly protein PilY1 n=1 Tax=Marinobacter pelagius TaxID=379482 RepID=A0A366GP66_9GAMM|nr:PilC/PilY family type IV pilus protein [Marinobacter pelagius]RBP29206.1 type IV pilus assembly protein PilY1 [Marinobacter pelagius]